MTLDDELDLVERAKNNASDFGKLYDYYFSKILAYIINRVINKETAEDLTSQVFLKAVENIQKFDTSNRVRFGSWLYRSAHNIVIDYFRTNKKYISDEIFESIKSNRTAEEMVEKDENRRVVAFTLTKLKPRYQYVISLSFFLELDDYEIAEVMNIKKQNVHVLLHRALKSFEKNFDKSFFKK